MTEQAWTIAGGLGGAAIGYYFSGKNPFWAGVGALAGAILTPQAASAAMPELPPSGTNTHVVQLVPGQTIIQRVEIGDVVTVLAPSGWGVPSATANIPGFMQVQSTAPDAEATVLKVTTGGQGQIQMSSGGEVATLSVEVTSGK